MEELKDDNIEELKKKLRSYKREQIQFNEPHFTQQLNLRDGNKEEVINHILNPDKLVYSYQEIGKCGDIIHCLHFDMSNTRTMRIPVIFKKDGKVLYIITYIIRYRSWHNMIKKD